MMLIGASALAGDDFTGPYLGLTGVYINPIGDVDEAGLKSEFDSGWGAALLAGYRFNKLIQLDGEFIWTKHDVLYQDRFADYIANDSTNMYQVLAEVNFHFLYYCGVQVYAGPVVGYAFFDQLDYSDAKYDVDDAWVFGGNLGIDVPLTSREDEKGWNFTARLKYLLIQPEVSVTGVCNYCGGIGDGGDNDPGSGYGSSEKIDFDIDIDPWVAQVGVMYKW